MEGVGGLPYIYFKLPVPIKIFILKNFSKKQVTDILNLKMTIYVWSHLQPRERPNGYKTSNHRDQIRTA
jgi:hypothetical protein